MNQRIAEGVKQAEESWTKQRKKALKRDRYSCKFCGMSNEDHTNSGKDDSGLDVHHIVPRQDGGSNRLSNLISVCRSCHSILESCTRKAIDSSRDQGDIRELKEQEKESEKRRLEIEELYRKKMELEIWEDSSRKSVVDYLDLNPTVRDEWGFEYSVPENRDATTGGTIDSSRVPMWTATPETISGERNLFYWYGYLKGIGLSVEKIDQAVDWPTWVDDLKL